MTTDGHGCRQDLALVHAISRAAIMTGRSHLGASHVVECIAGHGALAASTGCP